MTMHNETNPTEVDTASRLAAVAAHGSLFFGATIIWVPLLLWAVLRDDWPFSRRHTARAFDFQVVVAVVSVLAGFISLLLLAITGGIIAVTEASGVGVILVLFMWAMWLIVGAACVVLPIIAMVHAAMGKEYEYPFIPKMLALV